MTYADRARVRLDPTVVTEQNKKGLHGRIPAKAGSENSSCHSCGMKKAFGLLSESPMVSTVIVLVKSTKSSDSSTGKEDTLDVFKEDEDVIDVPVYAIVVGGKASVKQDKRLKLFAVVDEKPNNQQTQISDFLRTISNEQINNDESNGELKFYENQIENVTERFLSGKLLLI